MPHMNVLVLVESPAKTKKIAQYLPGTTVESTIGHFRDLPKSKADVPAHLQDRLGAHLGIDLLADFRPMYVVSPGKEHHVSKLRTLISRADRVILATDDDREGEGISKHVLDEFNIPPDRYDRVVFTEITKDAVTRAYANPRRLNEHLAQAQETRRLIDRMYGYEVSRVLGNRARNLTAGRVQSVAVKIVVQREYERINHVKAAYTTLTLTLDTTPGLSATSRTLAGQPIATPKDFDASTGQLSSGAVIFDPAAANAVARTLRTGSVTLTDRQDKPQSVAPHPPYTTSTLQQDASRKLKFNPATTMALAQSLYEGGFITYMRTDSTSLSEEAQQAARAHATAAHGPASVPAAPRQYAASKDAQAAHEAIRPAGSTWKDPQVTMKDIAATVKDGAQAALLYDLIFKRTVASQMINQEGTLTTFTFTATHATHGDVTFLARGKVISVPGWTLAYTAGQDDPEHDDDDQPSGGAPDLQVGATVDVTSARVNSKTTQPPARYTEAALVATLESEGVGRPSTYAAIIKRITDAGYVRSKGMALVPSIRALVATAWMERDFTELVDVTFTAAMESELDQIAAGNTARSAYLTGFYNMLTEILERAQANTAPIHVPHRHIDAMQGRLSLDSQGQGILDVGDVSTLIPTDLTPDDLTPDRLTNLLAHPTAPTSREGGILLGLCPRTGQPITLHDGRGGKYLRRAGEHPGDPAKTASVPRNEPLKFLDVRRAMNILDLKRRLGDGQPNETTIQFGDRGPYATRVIGGQRVFRNLSFERARTITLEELDALYAPTGTP